MCYRHLTLSLTTVKNWMNWGYMWGRDSSWTRPCLVKPPCIAPLKLRTAGLQSLKIERGLNSIPVQGLYVESSRPKDIIWNDKTPCKTLKMFGSPGKHLNFAVKKDVWCIFLGFCLFQSILDHEQILPTTRNLFHIAFLNGVFYKFAVMYYRWVSRCLETKLKKYLPASFKRAIGRKSESVFSEGLLTLGISHLKTSLKNFGKKFSYFGTSFVRHAI